MISRNVLYCCIKQDKKQEIFDTLTETGEDYKTAVAKLDEYFLPKKNVDYETFQFRQASQKSDETVDQFVTRLRKLAVHCEFADLERELKSAVIEHCTSKRLRRHALREEAMTLDKLLSKAQALEASETQAKGIEESTAQTNPSAESVKTSAEVNTLVDQYKSVRDINRVNAANVDCLGHIQGHHAQLKEKHVTVVENQIILPRCA